MEKLLKKMFKEKIVYDFFGKTFLFLSTHKTLFSKKKKVSYKGAKGMDTKLKNLELNIVGGGLLVYTHLLYKRTLKY